VRFLCWLTLTDFVAMSSYDHFCFLQHIRTSAFPHVNPSAVLPSAKGSAACCAMHSQRRVILIHRTFLRSRHSSHVQVLLLSFFSPENLPGRLSLSDVDQSIARCDGTFFDKNTGALSAYVKGVLIVNATWAAWRTLILLLSWYVSS
jgi:hypothetical protein